MQTEPIFTVEGELDAAARERLARWQVDRAYDWLQTYQEDEDPFTAVMEARGCLDVALELLTGERPGV